MKKLFLLVAIVCAFGMMAARSGSFHSTNDDSTHDFDYVDLGLPSGTLWKGSNEKGYLTYDQAINYYGNKLPTCEQFAELHAMCSWRWTGNGWNVTGPNGSFIFLPAAGYRNGESGQMRNVGEDGRYWTSSQPTQSGEVWCAFFSDTSFHGYCLHIKQRSHGLSIRLVQD